MISVDASFIAVSFIVWALVLLLTKVFFNPMRKILEERRVRIKTNHQEAEQNIKKFEEIALQIDEKLKAARAKSKALSEKLEREAWEEKQRILDEMNKICQSQVEAAKVKLKKQVENIKKQLEAKSKDLALKVEKKLLNN